MILVGNQRGGSANLAAHLLNDRDNDHVTVHEVRGFVSDTLPGALNEAYAVSRGTRCKQFLYSLSLNPPADKDVDIASFEDAVARAEVKLGLTDQPRAIVFHEKEGPGGMRRHCHAVWSRIDAEHMKAIPMSHDRMKLQDVSRDLYREHGWEMPRGLVDRSLRDPRNFTHAEWQQAKRTKKDPRDIKVAIQDAWSISDSKETFKHALAERGFHLAKGERRGFVAVDAVSDEVFGIARCASIKTKEVRARLGDEKALASLEEIRDQIARGMLPKLEAFKNDVSAKADLEKAEYLDRKEQMVAAQRQERSKQAIIIEQRQQAEALERQSRFRTGLGGIWDRLRGEHAKIIKRNEQDAINAQQRDRAETDALVQKHLQQRRELVRERRAKHKQAQELKQELRQDIQRYESMRQMTDHAPAQRDRRASYLQQRGQMPPEPAQQSKRHTHSGEFNRAANPARPDDHRQKYLQQRQSGSAGPRPPRRAPKR